MAIRKAGTGIFAAILIFGSPARASDPPVTAFKGIRYAAPPVGPLRWHAPEPAPPGSGAGPFDRFGPNCIQTIVEEKKPWTHEFMAHGEVSEDCLFLNIWAPAGPSSPKHPVFVYLHGGANYEGSGSIDAYTGEGLARKDVVMVTVNYRLGIFGFFVHPELSKESEHHASGNYALLDQIAALQWIRDNIARYGGDPARVTLAGQSAGGSDIALLIRSPLAKGLFQRAIMESGGISLGASAGARPLADAEADGLKFAQAKGAESLAGLRAMPWGDLVGSPGPRFGPVADGYVVPASSGWRNDVATLTGSNADENGASPNPKVTLEQFQTQARERYADRAAEFLRLYPAATAAEAALRSNEAARDRQRVTFELWAAARAVASKTPVYLYFYNHVLPGPDAPQYGAFHTSEVPYVLNTLEHSQRPFTDDDRNVAALLSSYWANFAATGNPNGKRLPHWPSAQEQPGMLMELGSHSQPIPAAGNDAKHAFWKRTLTTGL